MKGDDLRKMACVLQVIPKEMFWAYESVRQSGIFNMNGFTWHMAETRVDECFEIMKQTYYQYIIRGNIDLDKVNMPHLTRNHVRFIQECYSVCKDGYGIPDDLIEIKQKVYTETTYTLK